jgi:hypothetical protein
MLEHLLQVFERLLQSSIPFLQSIEQNLQSKQPILELSQRSLQLFLTLQLAFKHQLLARSQLLLTFEPLQPVFEQ